MLLNKKSRGGFTLVELLVVIAIISILTMLTVGQFQNARRKASDAQRKADLNALTKALQMYYADYGKFPVSLSGKISVDDGLTNIPWGDEFKDNASTPYTYMKVLPEEKKTLWPEYCYVTDANGTMYGLFAMLENIDDKECVNTSGVGDYSHCGNEEYCYATVSPNIIVSDLTLFVP